MIPSAQDLLLTTEYYSKGHMSKVKKTSSFEFIIKNKECKICKCIGPYGSECIVCNSLVPMLALLYIWRLCLPYAPWYLLLAPTPYCPELCLWSFYASIVISTIEAFVSFVCKFQSQALIRESFRHALTTPTSIRHASKIHTLLLV